MKYEVSISANQHTQEAEVTMYRHLKDLLATVVAVCAIPAFGASANPSNYRLTRSQVDLGGGLCVSTHYRIIGSIQPTPTFGLSAVIPGAAQPGPNDNVQNRPENRLATELGPASPNPCPVKTGC